MARAFVIRPFGKRKDSSGKEIDFERVHRKLIDPALQAAELDGSTTGEIIESGNIREDMFALILEADLVVCDITIHNANVFYELGIRHALRKKRTVLIKGEPTTDSPPFDILTDRYLAYEIDTPAVVKDKLIETITAALKSERTTDSPIFGMLPNLQEADPARVQIVPLDFREEVRRAQSAKAKGWLRLLADEVQHRRFQWEGLKVVATAQWDVGDYDGGCDSWEAIRETHPDDIIANLALANIFERLFRRYKRPELIEKSDQAISRVLHSESISRKQHAEALALRGRNQKTHWRLEFDHLDTTEKRRMAAMNRALIGSYKAYYDAFLEDLNHFYPGLSALQMGTILLDLSGENEWYDAFDSDNEADSYRDKLKKEVSSLRYLVATSVEAGLRRMDHGDPERMWAEISEADMLFMTDDRRERRVIGAYCDAIPRDKPFAWDAAKGQLKLFADLGVNADLARKVISEINARFVGSKPTEEDKPIHLVLFAGHRVDAPGRAKARFPEAQADRAKALIRDAVETLQDSEHEMIGLASAAPGADILAHEVCAELGLASRICLPMPADDFARLVFEKLDKWRTRFLNLQTDENTLVLSDCEGLPRWLHGSGIDPWERGNEWVMKMALAWGAGRITLVALWDGKEEGDAPGGTAHMVRLAENAGKVHIKRIHSRQLLN